MGRYSYGDKNESGKLLIKFAAKYNLYITPTSNRRSPENGNRPGGQYHNMIDLILIDKH